MSKRGRGGSAGAKFRISLGLPVGAVINCADNTGKNSFDQGPHSQSSLNEIVSAKFFTLKA